MAAHPDLLVVSGACNAYSGLGDAYLPFREALGMLSGDVESRWAAGRISREHARRLWQALSVILPALVQHGPFVVNSLVPGRDLVSRAEHVASGEDGWRTELRGLAEGRGSSGLTQSALFQQVTNVLQAVAAAYPLLIVLDDLQWADQGTMGLLFHLGRRLAGCRVLIVAAYRPEEIAVATSATVDGAPASQPHSLSKVLSELKRQFGDVWVDLREADKAEGRAFVDAILDTEPNRLGEGFRRALFARTGGHPLFTIELLHAMQTRGDVVRNAAGVWAAGEHLDWSSLPARVTAVIEERLGRLGEAERELLSVASVEGEIFTAETLAPVEGMTLRSVLRTLRRDLAGRHRLVREVEEVAADGGHLSRFAFVHVLFQAQLYGELSAGEQRLLHGEVAAALEDLHGESVDRVAVQLAYHYDRAGNDEKTIDYATRAGEQARRAYADDEAIRYYEMVLRRSEISIPGEPAAYKRWVALRGLGRLYFRCGDSTRAERYLREAIALGRQLELDPQTLVLLYHWLAEALIWQSRYEERIRIGEEGLRLVASDTRSVGAALMNQAIGMGAAYLDDWERGEAYTLRTAEFVRDLPYVEDLWYAYAHIIIVCRRNKDTKGFLEWVAALEEQATQHGDLVGLATAYLYAANHLVTTGHLRLALEKRQRQLEMYVRSGDKKHEGWAWSGLAWLHLATGDAMNAAAYATKALELKRAVGWRLYIAIELRQLGEVALSQGFWSQAIEHLRDAARVFGARGRPIGVQVLLRVGLGWAYLEAGQRAQALRSFSEGLQVICEPQNATHSGRHRQTLSNLLGGLEEAYGDTVAYLDWCERFKAERPRIVAWAPQLYLIPVEGQMAAGRLLHADAFAEPSSDWAWIDPLGDCGYQANSGLEIRAANGRDLWYMNLSAPRLVRDLPVAAHRWVVQVSIEPAMVDRPALGGLLLWRDEQNWLTLDLGRFGRRDITFAGCVDNEDVTIGRGRLPKGPEPGWAMGETVTLRLEADVRRVEALCSLDGEQWYSAGHATFPMDGTVQVGVHAIGMIDRNIYHGAYPEGTAIRFTSFRLWGTQVSAEPTSDTAEGLHHEEE